MTSDIIHLPRDGKPIELDPITTKKAEEIAKRKLRRREAIRLLEAKSSPFDVTLPQRRIWE